MIDGWTVSVEQLTWDERVPDVYDWLDPDSVNPEPKWVLRQYDTIVSWATFYVISGIPQIHPKTETLRTWLERYGAVLPGLPVNSTDHAPADWADFVLLADQLHAQHIAGQTERLPIAV